MILIENDEPDLETILNKHPATPNQIENVGLQYRFTYGTDMPVYRDTYGALCGFDPCGDGHYRLSLYIENGGCK